MTDTIFDSTVKEQVQVGTPAVLTSSHVSEGPGRIAAAPVPSVFIDDRGEIHRVRVGGKRLNLLHSKTNVMRSGYLHNHKTFTFVVSGKVELWLLEKEGTKKTTYGPNEVFTVASYYPHILHFLEDTTILEFWEGKFQCWYYHPYRRLVQLQNELVANQSTKSSSIGQYQRLVPAESAASEGSVLTQMLWMGTGIVIGAVAATTALFTLAVSRKR